MLGLTATLTAVHPIAATERRVPGPLFGGAAVLPTQVAPAVDPTLPPGAPFLVTPRLQAAATLCSPRHPLCVAGTTQQARQLPVALDRLESAYHLVHGVLSLPRPWTSATTPRFEVYLSDDPNLALATPVFTAVSAWADRASVSCRIPSRTLALGEMVRCLGFAIAGALDAAETPALMDAYAAHLVWLAGESSSGDVAGIDDLQVNPERTPVARVASASATGGVLLLESLERTWQHPRPGWTSTTLLGLSRREGISTGLSWQNEPDWFDVVRASLGESANDTADWLVGFALDRALLGLNSSGRLRGLAIAGDAARARFDWRMPFSSLPRRVALSKPLQPLGAAYLWLDLDRVPNGATLGFRADWEVPVAFKWLLLSLDDKGRELARLEVPYLETATSVERTWASFNAEGARAVVIAGVNLGAVDPAHPFDPDYEPWETHGCTVYLAKL
ncbi:MAG TPA: hypothetical protein VHO25_22930 [Polyangiaceae bacterium]|nr:hypothetical protein [Polyangiaceae bacterium]